MNNLHKIFIAAVQNLAEEQDRIPTPKQVGSVLQKVNSKFVETLFEGLDDESGELLRWEAEREHGFNERLRDEWKRGFDALTVLGSISQEIGEWAWENSKPEKGTAEQFRFEALSRLHARACLIFREMLCLLKGGYADGAFGRWRSLHETSTIALFLREQSPEVSERYLEHQFVQKWKRANTQRQYASRLKLTEIDQECWAVLERQYERVIGRFGKDFGGDYGWATKSLSKQRSKKKRGRPMPVRFTDVEASVGIDHLRPYYKWACENIHASTNGLYRPLGLFRRDDMMLAGPTNYGLADPAQMAALSLYQATAALVTRYPTLDLLVPLQVCGKFRDLVRDVFTEIQKQIEEDETALRASGDSPWSGDELVLNERVEQDL